MTTTFARVTPIVTDPCTLPSARLPRRGRIVADDWTPRAPKRSDEETAEVTCSRCNAAPGWPCVVTEEDRRALATVLPGVTMPSAGAPRALTHLARWDAAKAGAA